jgi:hypothetical protein
VEDLRYHAQPTLGAAQIQVARQVERQHLHLHQDLLAGVEQLCCRLTHAIQPWRLDPIDQQARVPILLVKRPG